MKLYIVFEDDDGEHVQFVVPNVAVIDDGEEYSITFCPGSFKDGLKVLSNAEFKSLKENLIDSLSSCFDPFNVPEEDNCDDL